MGPGERGYIFLLSEGICPLFFDAMVLLMQNNFTIYLLSFSFFFFPKSYQPGLGLPNGKGDQIAKLTIPMPGWP